MIFCLLIAIAAVSQGVDMRLLPLACLSLPTLAAHLNQNNLDIIRGVADDAAFIGSALFAGKVDGYEFKTDVQVVQWLNVNEIREVNRDTGSIPFDGSMVGAFSMIFCLLLFPLGVLLS